MITIDGFLIDAALAETHTAESEVTQFPTETGSDITDNNRLIPRTVSITGVVSNTPIGTVATSRAKTGAAVAAIARTLGGPLLSDVHEPTANALAVFDRVRANRKPVTIETSLRVYTNMVLTQLEIPRSADDGDSLNFTAAFQEIIIVTNERTDVRVSKPSSGRKHYRDFQGVRSYDVGFAGTSAAGPSDKVYYSTGGLGFQDPDQAGAADTFPAEIQDSQVNPSAVGNLDRPAVFPDNTLSQSQTRADYFAHRPLGGGGNVAP